MALVDYFQEARGVLSPDRRVPITIRALVEWTYAEQKAHRGCDAFGSGGCISQTGIMGEIGRLGCLVDRSRRGSQAWGAVQSDGDALYVHGIAEHLAVTYRLALMHYGELRSIPDWQPHIMPLRCMAVPGRKGQPKGIYVHNGKTHVGDELTLQGDIPTRRQAEAMRKAWPDAPHLRCVEDVIEQARAAYSEWFAALHTLKARLKSGCMSRWRVDGVGARAEPWVATI